MPFGGADHLSDQIFHAPRNAAKLRTLSVTYPLCGSALTDPTDNPSEMRPLKLTDFCLFCNMNQHILQAPHIPPITFISYHDRVSNLLPPDESAGTLTTQPIQLAYTFIQLAYAFLLVR